MQLDPQPENTAVPVRFSTEHIGTQRLGAPAHSLERAVRTARQNSLLASRGYARAADLWPRENSVLSDSDCQRERYIADSLMGADRHQEAQNQPQRFGYQ